MWSRLALRRRRGWLRLWLHLQLQLLHIVGLLQLELLDSRTFRVETRIEMAG